MHGLENRRKRRQKHLRAGSLNLRPAVAEFCTAIRIPLSTGPDVSLRPIHRDPMAVDPIQRIHRSTPSPEIPSTEAGCRRCHLRALQVEWGRRVDARGFTLIEVTVVVFLIGILLLVAMPRLPEAPLADHSRKTSRWLVLKIKDLKQRAVREQKVYSLQVDIDGNRFWITREDMTEEQKMAAEEQAYRPGGTVRVVDVEFPQQELSGVGAAEIRFYPRGYSDRAMVHVDDGDQRFSFRIEPFLSRVKIYESYVGYKRG